MKKKAAPKKEAPPTLDAQSAKRQAVAQLAGTLAGLPAACQRAADALEDIRQRRESARRTTGLLNSNQIFAIDKIGNAAHEGALEISENRCFADILARHDAVPPADIDLFA